MNDNSMTPGYTFTVKRESDKPAAAITHLSSLSPGPLL